MSKNNSRHEFIIHIQRADGTPVGHTPANVDLVPALDWGRFAAIRKGFIPPSMTAGVYEIEPVWSSEPGQQYITGFQTEFSEAPGIKGLITRFPITYFDSAARSASLYFAEKGHLNSGDSVRYRVSARKQQDQPEDPPGENMSLQVNELARPLPLRTRKSLSDLIGRSRVMGEAAEVDMPVFMHKKVLDKIEAQTKRAGASETGGVLIGYLHQNENSSEIIAEVTACIPAEHTVSTLTSLRFMPETWAAVRLGIRQRRKSEIILGWYHSHSYFKETCKDCSQAELGTCSSSAVFMSSDDCQLHRVAFSSPWNVAIVVSDSPCSGLQYGLFGWRYGVVAQRAFNILTDVVQVRNEPVATDERITLKGVENESN